MKTYGGVEVQLRCNKNFQKSRRHYRILGVGKFTGGNLHTGRPQVLDTAVKEGCHHDDLAPEICPFRRLHNVFFLTSGLNWNVWKVPLVLHRTKVWFGPRNALENESLFVMPLANPLYHLAIIFLTYYDSNSFIDDKTMYYVRFFVLLCDKIKQ